MENIVNINMEGVNLNDSSLYDTMDATVTSTEYNFVYLTKNLINGKLYIGDHSTNNLNDHYIGSGKLISCAIKKYGKKNFEFKILEFFNTKQEAFNAQQKYIIEYKTLNPCGYNISPTGGLMKSGHHSDETRKKLSESHKGKDTWNKGKINCYSEETLLNWSKTRKGRPILNKSSFCVSRKHTEETKNKIREKQLGEKNSMFGKPAWDTVNKIKIKCEYCDVLTNKGNYGRWHGNRCKHKI